MQSILAFITYLHILTIRLRNLCYYHLGYELVNLRPRKKHQRTYPITVRKVHGKQIRNNPLRDTDYSLDDPFWAPSYQHPELFL